METQKNGIILQGIPAAHGIAVGKIFMFVKEIPSAYERELKDIEIEREVEKLKNAITKSEKELTKILTFARGKIGDNQSKIFEAQIMILQDEILFESVVKRIKNEQKNAEYIISDEIGKYERMMLMAHDDYMHERAHDVDDLKNRIIRNLQENKLVSKFDESAVVVSHILTSADTVILSRNNVLGYVTDKGGITSHAAILARALMIPAVMGLGDISRKVSSGDTIILDGYSGHVVINPTADQIEEYNAKKNKYAEFESQLLNMKNLPAITIDGRKIDLSANIELEEELEHLKLQGADGIGLYRSESLLLDRDNIPSEEEQFQMYKLLSDRTYPGKVIIRTFDIGGDKIAYHMVEESNPFLGWRGIRIFLDHPEILREQIRAILRASTRKNLSIMFPMVSILDEVLQINKYVEQVKEELKLDKIKFDNDIQIGVMIEVPSAAVTAESIANEVDFLSIGTNDLTQYLLAVDRGNDIVSSLYQEFHPSVLKTIKHIIDSGHKKGKWVGVCGEVAGNPLATILLLGFGLDEFSVVPSMVPEIKKIIRSISYKEAQIVAEKALSMNTSKEIQDFIRDYMHKHMSEIPLENDYKQK